MGPYAPESTVFNNTSEGTTFYLSDGSGHRITDSDFSIDLPDGTKECLPWTLRNYMRVSCVKFPSRTRLYCVAILPSEN